jgi:hypothetical protein
MRKSGWSAGIRRDRRRQLRSPSAQSHCLTRSPSRASMPCKARVRTWSGAYEVPDDWIDMRASATSCESTSARCERARRCSASRLLPGSSELLDPREQLTADSRMRGNGCSLMCFTTPSARPAHAGGIHQGDPPVAAGTQGHRDTVPLWFSTGRQIRDFVRTGAPVTTRQALSHTLADPVGARNLIHAGQAV